MNHKKILVVDDDALVLKAVARDLRIAGWEPVLSTLPVNPVSEDVVLADWNPYGPKMVELAKRWNVPVVVFTAEPEWVPPGLAVVTKPWKSEELQVALCAAITTRR